MKKKAKPKFRVGQVVSLRNYPARRYGYIASVPCLALGERLFKVAGLGLGTRLMYEGKELRPLNSRERGRR